MGSIQRRNSIREKDKPTPPFAQTPPPSRSQGNIPPLPSPSSSRSSSKQPTMDEDLPQGSEEGISHISIWGPTLASLLHLLSSSPSDCNGLLFGHLSSPPSPSLHDDVDNPNPFPPPSPCPLPSLTITSLLSLSSPTTSLLNSSPSLSLAVGFFSGRRSSPLRPSMRERFFLTSFLSQLQTTKPKTFVLLLLTSSPSANVAVHTHTYRAFELRPGGALDPRPVHVVNVGPAFRGHYGAFAPASRFPWVPCGGGGRRGTSDGKERETVDALAEGFGAERLRGLAGAGPAAHARELEELYERMLSRLARLARLVEESSKKVDEQESRNMKLRSRIFGLE